MAVSAADLPKWQASKYCAAKYFIFLKRFLLHLSILPVESKHHPNGETTMNQFPRMAGLLDDTDTINALLSQLAEDGTVEPMVEPIDDPSNLTDFWDWAEVVGVVDEFAPLDERF
jgi:hypothetical protein